MRKIMLCLMLAPAIYSCKKEKEIEKAPEKKLEIDGKSNLKLPPVYLDTLNSEKDILEHIVKRKKDIFEALKSSSAEQADEIYENYKKENDSVLVLLERKQPDLLEKFYEYDEYDPERQTSTMKFPDDVKKIVTNYEKSGIEFWGIGEGITVLRMFPDFYFEIFNKKLSPDYQQYLEIITEEDKVLFVSDAAITVPWSDAAKRVEVREKFLKDFPKSKLNKMVTEELKEYRYAYLCGYDNTQTNEQGRFYPENLKEFQRFTKKNPNSETTALIKEMLSKQRSSEELYQLVRERLGITY